MDSTQGATERTGKPASRAAAGRAGNSGWLYCAGCGNPCRAPVRPGEYACPRCGRRLGARGTAGRARRAAGIAGETTRRAALLISVITLVALAGIGATLSRMARAEGKALITQGLTEDPFALDGESVYLRTFRSLRRMRLSDDRRIALTHGTAGLFAAILADGWVYWVTRPWGPYQGVLEIRRAPAGGGPEETLVRFDDGASFPRGIAVAAGRLYVLVNERTDEAAWRARLLRIDPGGRRETLPLVASTPRPLSDFVVDRDDPDRVLWLLPDFWTPGKEIPGALCEALFRGRKIRRLLTLPHPSALAQDEGSLYWLNDVYDRPRMPNLNPRFGTPRVTTPADAVQLQILPRGARRPVTYTLPEPPTGFRGILYHGHFYWMALRDAPNERESRADVLRMSLATRGVTAITHLRGGSLGPTCWFLRDRADRGLFLAERYLYDDWLDWSTRGLSPRQLCRIWRLKTE
jgi:hypothetical protein